MQEKLLKINLTNKFGLSALHTASRLANSFLRNIENVELFQIQHSKCAAMPATASKNPSQLGNSPREYSSNGGNQVWECGCAEDPPEG